MQPPLQHLGEWSPFSIDALGLITLLGSEALDTVLGQMICNPVTQYLPLLGGQIIASNSIVSPRIGFALYNVNDGIKATDLAGWFARWLSCEGAQFSGTTLRIRREKRPAAPAKRLIGLASGALGLLPLVLGILIVDWWAVVNGLVMAASVLVRLVVMNQNHRALDLSAMGADGTSSEMVRCFVTLPDGKAITIMTTRGIVLDCLLTDPRPPHPRLYQAARIAGWAAFGIHVVVLGMSPLICQLPTVVVMLTATVATVYQVGADLYRIGHEICISRDDAEERFRAAAYARLQLSEEEEISMVNWHLFPQKTNTMWWQKYKDYAKDMKFSNWNKTLAKTIS
ncbi:hypothetical protein LZ31DRAFT_550105 [Colletotrichum somersetense]|nr:hypothetical protein LZ31DRAFT_550105 [Colletotrichum somersetense]